MMKCCSELGRCRGFHLFVLILCVLSVWNTQASGASADSPVNQEAPSTCVTCSKHEELMAKLGDLRQSAQVLSHRMEKVGTKLDNLEQCGCVPK